MLYCVSCLLPVSLDYGIFALSVILCIYIFPALCITIDSGIFALHICYITYILLTFFVLLDFGIFCASVSCTLYFYCLATAPVLLIWTLWSFRNLSRRNNCTLLIIIISFCLMFCAIPSTIKTNILIFCSL